MGGPNRLAALTRQWCGRNWLTFLARDGWPVSDAGCGWCEERALAGAGLRAMRDHSARTPAGCWGCDLSAGRSTSETPIANRSAAASGLPLKR